LDTVICKM
jgi:hypothetical protein